MNCNKIEFHVNIFAFSQSILQNFSLHCHLQSHSFFLFSYFFASLYLLFTKCIAKSTEFKKFQSLVRFQHIYLMLRAHVTTAKKKICNKFISISCFSSHLNQNLLKQTDASKHVDNKFQRKKT